MQSLTDTLWVTSRIVHKHTLTTARLNQAVASWDKMLSSSISCILFSSFLHKHIPQCCFSLLFLLYIHFYSVQSFSVISSCSHTKWQSLHIMQNVNVYSKSLPEALICCPHQQTRKISSNRCHKTVIMWYRSLNVLAEGLWDSCSVRTFTE